MARQSNKPVGKTMKAIVQTGREEVEVQEVSQPSPSADEVLVRVEYAGVCGSDVHAYLQMDGFEWVKMPRVMGHEYVGTVVEIGENVSRVSVGETVVEIPIHPCGECHQCEIGEENVCQNTTLVGMETDGAYSEYTTVDANQLIVIPDKIETRHAAVTEPLAIAARASYERADVTPGDTALVQGPGPIGMLIAALLDSLGAHVIVSGLGKDTEYRLPLAEELGIETVDISETNLNEYVEEVTDGIGVDTVFDTTGHKSGVETAVEYVRKGGEVIVVGLPGEASELFFSPIVRGERDVKTSYGATRENYKQAVNVLEVGAVNVDTIIDTRYDSDDPTSAFEDFLAGQTCKPMFSFR
ncbi:alcohol dehydrogenase catalytic domain-containing protein [Haladaptatus sp. AB643]|uniref:zinc-dependent alcohol dehydrogenase n=2 Tax=unclassified Haladaptatus TaxID=2622732 RepID=UPI0026E5471A|nr:alcohol dehydrogenase catalytic domain-containing protein [Haladaptatus sp. AB643]